MGVTRRTARNDNRTSTHFERAKQKTGGWARKATMAEFLCGWPVGGPTPEMERRPSAVQKRPTIHRHHCIRSIGNHVKFTRFGIGFPALHPSWSPPHLGSLTTPRIPLISSLDHLRVLPKSGSSFLGRVLDARRMVTSHPSPPHIDPTDFCVAF